MVSIEKLIEENVILENSSIFLTEATSTRSTKLQIISNDRFKITLAGLNSSLNLSTLTLEYILQLLKENSQELLETAYRLVLSLQVIVDGHISNLSFQCPIDLEELFKCTASKEDFSITFNTDKSIIDLNSQFLLSIEVINKSEENLVFSIFIMDPNTNDPLMKDEDVRGYLTGNILLQHYQKYQSSLISLLPLKGSFEEVHLEGSSCVKLSFPFIASRVGTFWLPLVRIFNHVNSKVLDFKEIVQVKIVKSVNSDECFRQKSFI